MEKLLSPATQMLRKNAAPINLVLLVLVVMFLFPVKHFLPYDIKEKVEGELKTLTSNPWVMVLISILVLSVFYSGNMNMLVLLLFLIHHIKN